MPESPLQLGEIVVVGGGCYGTFYTGQLVEARDKGKLTYRRLLVIDHAPECQVRKTRPEAGDYELVVEDWDAFFDDYLGLAVEGNRGLPPNSVIVPSPLMPHLMYRWLLRRARLRWPDRTVGTGPLEEMIGTPYETTAPDLTRYVSFADWICPTHCIEPASCPVIKAPRTWEMSEALEKYLRRGRPGMRESGPVLFVCRHKVHGVGGFAVDDVVAGDRLVAEAGADGGVVDVIVGTISACHGAVNALRIGASGSLPASGNP
jgi:hypothetical protein